MAIGTGAEGLVVVEEEDVQNGSEEMQGFGCKFCSVEEAVKVFCSPSPP